MFISLILTSPFHILLGQPVHVSTERASFIFFAASFSLSLAGPEIATLGGTRIWLVAVVILAPLRCAPLRSFCTHFYKSLRRLVAITTYPVCFSSFPSCWIDSFLTSHFLPVPSLFGEGSPLSSTRGDPAPKAVCRMTWDFGDEWRRRHGMV